MKIRYLPNQPHCFAFGGFEVQMLSTLKAVQRLGINAEKLDIWNRDSDFDILHVWGLEAAHEKAIHLALRDKKKVIITALFPDFESQKRKIRHFLSTYFGRAKYMIEIASQVNKIVVVNDVEADIAIKYFKIHHRKIEYIPNIVDESYWESNFEPKLRKGDYPSNFVLCTGNICVRKNQLNLIKACKQLGLNVVLMGNPLLGEEEYCNEVEKFVDSKSVVWIKNIKENSEQLIEAYKQCSIFALPSVHEQGPISAYEAILLNCKILLADRKYSYQKFFQNIERVNPFDVSAIAKGLNNIITHPEKYNPVQSFMEPCRSYNVGNQYVNLYNKI